VKYLLDVNALIALGVRQHLFHGRVSNWVRAQPKSTQLLTCSIVALGFVRILSQIPTYQFSVREANSLLSVIGRAYAILFVADHRDLMHLPKWVKSHKQLTDGHLVDLAHAHTALLATFDKAIPGAFLIP
jgi:predicted nucleic acid-binding protein